MDKIVALFCAFIVWPVVVALVYAEHRVEQVRKQVSTEIISTCPAGWQTALRIGTELRCFAGQKVYAENLRRTQ